MSQRTTLATFNPADPYPEANYCVFGGTRYKPRWMTRASHVVSALKWALVVNYNGKGEVIYYLDGVRVWKRDLAGEWAELTLAKRFSSKDRLKKLGDFVQ